MCTLIVLHRCLPGKPLVVAANRDEFFARPTEGPAIRQSQSGRILAPRDLEAGGSWVGLSEKGVFAGLTNLQPIAGTQARTSLVGASGDARDSATGIARSVASSRDDRKAKTLRSRGEVVMAALEARTAEEAAESLLRRLSRLEEDAYNPFQLCVADANSAALLVYRTRPMIFALEPGLHVVGNVEDERAAAVLSERNEKNEKDEPLADSRGAMVETGDGKLFTGFEGIEGLIDTEEPRAQKLMRIRGRVEKLLTEPGRDLFEGLARICREHVEQGSPDELGTLPRPKSPFESTCVHVADRYGTRSSLLLELSEDVPTSRLWTTDGPPCRRPFEDRSSLLRELGVRLSA